MKHLVLVVALAGSIAPAARGQSPEELDRALNRLVSDYTDLYAKETLPQWRSLFLPTFSVASTTAAGAVSVRGLDQFYGSQERSFATTQKMGERLENVRIERRGRMASVWADFVFWQNDESSRGRLVLLAIHQREGWRFHSLMFSYQD